MALTYNSWLAAVANLAGTTQTNPFLVIELPNAIDYAELRMYRDLDLISTITRDSTQTTVINNRNISIPTPFVVVNGVNIITPASTQPDSGKRNQLVKVSEDYLDFCWPDSLSAMLPTKYALLNQLTMLLGPWPDSTYAVEIIGTQRPTPLSSVNQTTFLSQNIPDLFIAASMIHISGYQKNFGSQADDPRTAVSWETQYMKLLASADAEELRKRYSGTTMLPPPGTAKASTAPGAAKQ